jgi:hypothetical protein
MRALILCGVLGLAGLGFAGCGGGSLLGEGEPCHSSAECEVGLLCDRGRTPAVCAKDPTRRDLSVVMTTEDLAVADLASTISD